MIRDLMFPASGTAGDENALTAAIELASQLDAHLSLVLTVNLEPVYGIILAYLIFGESEHMSPLFYAASLIMILAIVVNGILKSRKRLKEAV